MRNRTIKTALVAALALLALADAASAYYSPRLGRFLSRDPINEPGAVLVRQAARPATAFIPRDPIQQADKDSADKAGLYSYVRNAPTNSVDPLGLKPFQGCNEAQKSSIEVAKKTACECIASVKPEDVSPCFKKAIECMKDKCPKYHVHCDNCSKYCKDFPPGPRGVGGHAISCSLGLGSHITVCGNNLGKGFPGGEARTIMHELSHCCGTKDDWWIGAKPGCTAEDLEGELAKKCGF